MYSYPCRVCYSLHVWTSFCTVDSDGRVSWNTQAVGALLDRCTGIWRLLSYAQSFFGKISIRFPSPLESEETPVTCVQTHQRLQGSQ